MKVSELIEQLKLVPDQEIPEGVLFMDWVRDNSPPLIPESSETYFIRSIEELLHERSYSGTKRPKEILVGFSVMKGICKELGIPVQSQLTLFGIELVADQRFDKDLLYIAR
jgi:hypothetical protein